MKCKNCGATLDEGALFCRKCGTAVPETPAPKRSALTAAKDRIVGFFAGVGAWCSAAIAKIGDGISKLKDSGLLKKRRFLMMCGAALLLLIVLIVVIACAASCKKTVKYETPDELSVAVVETLNAGDGEKLYEMAKLSEKALGVHTEIFGAGDTPETVMQRYYTRLAGDLETTLTERYGGEYRLEGQLETTIVADTSIFETNRTLGLEAARYAEITGPLSVNGEQVTNIRIVAVETDGEWKLIVVYLY